MESEGKMNDRLEPSSFGRAEKNGETPALCKSPSEKLQGRPANQWCIAERI